MSETLLPSLYQNFIHLSRYSRWIDELGRRETWEETVDRYMNYMCDTQCEGKIPEETKKELREAIINLEVMPSMRALMTAGPALERDNVAGFNCSYIPIDHQQSFDELLYILMCGTGVGFSVEKDYIAQLPRVSESFRKSNSVIKVEDSKIGWAAAYREMVGFLYQGVIPKWDVSQIRPAGSRLKTFGGRASGPEPLEDLFRFSIKTFRNAAGRKLSSLECHDICCKIAEVVVVGGVRRSALISLTNPTDDRMRHAKSGAWWEQDNQRQLANISSCYTDKPDIGFFMREWQALYESRSGERGIFSREACTRKVQQFGRRDPEHLFGTNPCSEIILRPNQFCNLSEVIIRPDDTEESVARKVRLATILGTMQSTMTKFRYLRDIWRRNTEEERLLGVSMTGILDCAMMYGRTEKQIEALPGLLERLRGVAVATNKEFADMLGINPSAAITCVKPSGTVSQLANCSSGIHPRHSEYFIRNVRGDKKDPMSLFMFSQGFISEDEIGKEQFNFVFSFPMKTPKRALTREDVGSLDHLELWKTYQRHWCEHKVSITVNVKEHEWMRVGAWVYDNFDEMSGIAFLPHYDHCYNQAPYIEIGKKEYEKLVEQAPSEVDWSGLSEFEKDDMTNGSQILACAGGSCDTADFVKE